MEWRGPLIKQGTLYQSVIKTHNSKVELEVFENPDEALSFINKMEEPAFVISCGSEGENFFSLIHEKSLVVLGLYLKRRSLQ